MLLRRRLAALAAGFAVLVSSALVAAPGATAATPPVLETVSVSTTSVTTPGSVTLSYTAQLSAPLQRALAGYTDEAGRLYSVTLTNGTSGSGVLNLPDGVRNGLWKLQYVYLAADLATSTPTYVCRTGRLNSGCTQFRDLSAYDVTVSGSTWDVAAPVVSAVSFTPRPAQAAGSVSVAFVADEVHTINRVALTLRSTAVEAKGHTIDLASSDQAQLAGRSFTATVPSTAYDGAYELTYLFVQDTLGNTATYYPDGRVSLSGGATAPTQHSIDFAATTLAVTGSTRDVTPPSLTALVTDPATAVVGGSLAVQYAVTETQSALAQVRVSWRRADGAVFGGSTAAQPPLTGQLTTRPTRPGVFQVDSVAVTDSVGNTMTYRRDGTTFNGTTKVSGTHALDLSRGDVTVLPSQVAAVTAVPHSSGVVLHWSVDPVEAADLTYRVTVQPGGRVVDVPAPTSPTEYEATARVDGLVNGHAYTFSVVGRSAVGAGAPGSVVAEPMMSDRLFAFGGPVGIFDRSDSNGDGRTDLFAVATSDSSVYRYLGDGRGGFTGRRQLVEPYPNGRVVSGGNLAGSGFPTTLVVDSGGTLEVHGTMIDGSVYAIWALGSGWRTMRFIDGGVDFSGDGRTDVLAVTATGDMRLYPGHGDGSVGSGRTIGTGWGSMLAVFSPGDLSGDRRADVVAVDPAGSLWLYRGNGAGGWLAGRTRIGSGWAGFGAVFAARDLSGDGRMDLAAVTPRGDLVLYAGQGNGTFAKARTIGTGWGIYL